MPVEDHNACTPSWTLSSHGPEKFETLFLPHLSFLRRWVKGKVQNSDDAEDIIQQTLLLGLLHVDQFRFEASFATWLCRIAINVIRGRYRWPYYLRTVLTEPKILESLQFEDATYSPLSVLERKETRKTLHRAISELPDIYREILQLRLTGRSTEECAELLGITRAAVKSRQHRARGLLAKLIQEQRVHTRKVNPFEVLEVPRGAAEGIAVQAA
jgi:RNA polymerase sigma-70 factor (ECF subfamily)